MNIIEVNDLSKVYEKDQFPDVVCNGSGGGILVPGKCGGMKDRGAALYQCEFLKQVIFPDLAGTVHKSFVALTAIR